MYLAVFIVRWNFLEKRKGGILTKFNNFANLEGLPHTHYLLFHPLGSYEGIAESTAKCEILQNIFIKN